MYTKEVDGSKWQWCIYHSAYCKHDSAKCYGNPKNGGHKILDEEGKTIPTPKASTADNSLTASMANVGIDDVIEEEEEEDSEDQE